MTLPRGVRLVQAVPSQLRFDFESRAYRSIPVVPQITGEGQNGYVIASQRVQPGELVIVGPATHVARINQATTDPVDVSRAVGTSEYQVNAFVADPYVRFQSSPQVEVIVAMKKQ